MNKDNIFQELDGDSASFIKKADLGLILDIGDFYRLGDVAFLVEENDIETLSIDHHAKSDNDLFKNEYIDVKASSVGEILYSFFKEIEHKISEEMMLGIYVAVLTDTGSFRHSNTTIYAIKLLLMPFKWDWIFLKYIKTFMKTHQLAE